MATKKKVAAKKAVKKKVAASAEESTDDTIAKLMAGMGGGAFDAKKYDEDELVTAERAAEHINYIMVPDLWHMYALGRVGYALGRFVHVLGGEGSGKTTWVYDLAKTFFDAGGLAGMVETERAISLDHMRARLGPHYDLFNQFTKVPNSFDTALRMLEDLLKRFMKDDPDGKVAKLLIMDTIAGSGTLAGLGADVSQAAAGGVAHKARMMRDVVERMKYPIHKTNTMVVYTNQGKEELGDIGGGGGPAPKKSELDKVKGQGGKALPFAASFEMLVKRGAVITKDGEKTGFTNRITFKKNKLRFPFRYYENHVNFNGDPSTKPTLDLLTRAGIAGMKTAGGRYWAPGVGIPKSESLPRADMYEYIHSPEVIGYFMDKLDIKMPEGGMDRVFFPTSWGDRRPVLASDGETEDLDVVDREAEAAAAEEEEKNA